MNWIPRNITTFPPSKKNLSGWAEQLEISPMLISLLWSRGITSLEDIEFFLNPGLRNLSSLEEWPGLMDAAQLLTKSALSGKCICVWGDYDVDGITSTALVKDFFRQHGFLCKHHIPNRLTEGYGLSKEWITRLAEEGVNLLLTVDSGISDFEEISYAKSLGITVIISDHHLPANELPVADCIVNPKVAPCPCPALAGVGVAFFLMAAMNVCLQQAGKQRVDIRSLLDLVALGTLADLVDVNGQNRVLIKNGLLQITSGQRPGIAALKNICKFSPSATLGASQVVFSLAPRINAAGRMGSSEVALDLLLSTNIHEAMNLANELNALNTKRRQEEDTIFEEAVSLAEKAVAKGNYGLMLHSENWHPGIIGIVASRIVERFHRPTVILSTTGDFLKGSGRSFGNLDLHDTFSRCSDLLLRYGGHKMAAGLSLLQENLEDLRKRFEEIIKKNFGKELPDKTCKIDAQMGFDQAADFTILKELELLQPFGNGNAEPVFASPPVKIKNIFAKQNFCTLDLEDEQNKVTLRAKAWRELANFPPELKGSYIKIAFSPRIDRYNGVAAVELRIKDWKKNSEVIPDFFTF